MHTHLSSSPQYTFTIFFYLKIFKQSVHNCIAFKQLRSVRSRTSANPDMRCFPSNLSSSSGWEKTAVLQQSWDSAKGAPIPPIKHSSSNEYKLPFTTQSVWLLEEKPWQTAAISGLVNLKPIIIFTQFSFPSITVT